MPSRAAPPSLLRRENRPIHLIGSRAAECPTAIAVCPPHKLVAVAAAARGGDNYGDVSSRIDLIRLWREDGEQELRRPLKAIASIRDPTGFFHRRLAWSRRVTSSQYPLGLLAAGLDNGAVHIWDPSRLLYEPNMDTTMDELFEGRRVSWSDDDGVYSSCSLHVILYDLDGRPKSHTVVDEAPEIILEDKAKKGVADMRSKLDRLIKDHAAKQRSREVSQQEMKHHGSEDGWQIIGKEEVTAKAHGLDDSIWNGLVLKLNDLTGPVLGLSFNHEYVNMLACAAYGEKLRIYYLDRPDEFACRGRDDLSTQITFLDWNPVFPSILASTCDIGETKIWDLRERSSKSIFIQKLRCSEVHWSPSEPLIFAVASNVNCESPVKIWDARNNREPLYEFGNAKGVTSLSWSASGLITTTDVDGSIDCWKLDENRTDNPIAAAYGLASGPANRG